MRSNPIWPTETEEKLLQQILNTDIVDITSFDGGFVYTDKEDLEDGACKISFYEYEEEEEEEEYEEDWFIEMGM